MEVATVAIEPVALKVPVFGSYSLGRGEVSRPSLPPAYEDAAIGEKGRGVAVAGAFIEPVGVNLPVFGS